MWSDSNTIYMTVVICCNIIQYLVIRFSWMTLLDPTYVKIKSNSKSILRKKMKWLKPFLLYGSELKQIRTHSWWTRRGWMAGWALRRWRQWSGWCVLPHTRLAAWCRRWMWSYRWGSGHSSLGIEWIHKAPDWVPRTQKVLPHRYSSPWRRWHNVVMEILLKHQQIQTNIFALLKYSATSFYVCAASVKKILS